MPLALHKKKWPASRLINTNYGILRIVDESLRQSDITSIHRRHIYCLKHLFGFFFSWHINSFYAVWLKQFYASVHYAKMANIFSFTFALLFMLYGMWCDYNIIYLHSIGTMYFASHDDCMTEQNESIEIHRRRQTKKYWVKNFNICSSSLKWCRFNWFDIRRKCVEVYFSY